MADSILTAAYLREVLFYNQDTGVFTWVKKVNQKCRVGSVAGYFCKHIGYVLIHVNGRKYRAHRLAWLYMTGGWPDLMVDHKDRNTANNVWSNLRLATAVENGRNRSANRSSKSGVIGVSWCEVRQQWRAILTLGYFTEIKDAALARKTAADAVFGEFAP